MKRAGIALLVSIVILSLAVPNAAAGLDQDGLPPMWRADHPVVPHLFSDMGSHSLGIDADDHLHYAYGGDRLYYTHNDGAGWAAPVAVDSDLGVGRGTSLALDSAGYVHISYVDTALGGIRYATNKSGSWVVTRVTTGEHISPHTALALDTSGRPNILYHYSDTDGLGYYHQLAGGSWEGYPINLSGEGGAGVAVAIGTDNVIRISFYKVKDGTQGCLMYRAASGGWGSPAEEVHCELISNGPTGTISDIAVDSDNHPYIAFDDTNTVDVYRFNGSAWVHNVPVSGDPSLTFISMVVDGSENTHLLYNSSNMLKYATYIGGAWNYDDLTVDDNDHFHDGSLVLDSAGLARAAYYRPEWNMLRSKALQSGNWQAAQPIDALGTEAGRCTSLAFSSNGKAHLTYYDTAAERIKYATKTSGGTWSLSPDVVDTLPVYCEHSLDLRNGIPSVAYTTKAGELRYADYLCRGACAWDSHSVALPDLAMAARSVSLAHTSNGKPRISFIQNAQARLAYNNGSTWISGWVISPIAANHASGQTSLAIDTNDKARVAYFRDVDNDLYYAIEVDLGTDSWTQQLVDANAAGPYVSLQLYSLLNLARVAYTSTNVLRFRQQGFLISEGVYWTGIETVYSWNVEWPRLMLDPGGPARLFWYTPKDNHLHESTRAGGDWSTATLDRTYLAGSGLDLAISPLTGKPALSYFDENIFGVKYIYELIPVYLPFVKR